MKCDELNAYKADVYIPVYGSIADAEVYLKEKADEAIAELKHKLEDVNELIKTARQMLEDAKASHYAEMVDAGMRERRLKRAVYKACENWADAEVFSRVKSVYDDNTEANKWAIMRNKCRAKAKEYK